MNVPYMSRPTVYASNGMVCSHSPLAASIGIKILSEGGNAFDAAIATAAMEAITVPGMCGFGGEVFAMFYDAKTGKTLGLTSTGIAPALATSDYFRSRGYDSMPIDGPLAVSPPGELAAYEYLNHQYGTMSMSELLSYAIKYAEEGHPITPRASRVFASMKNRILKFPSTSKIFLKKDGSSYKAGELFKNPDLANTLKVISKEGTESFYKGAIASKIVEEFGKAGGILDLESLANHQVEIYDPITTDYRGYVVAENRPPSQGFMLLEMLNIMEGFDVKGYGHLDPDLMHLMIESKKLAFADRNAYLGDPNFENNPLEELISKEFAEKRRNTIDHKNAGKNIGPGNPIKEGTDTSYFCIVDKDGNAISFIHSLYNGFGSAFVAEGTGILFNNRQQGFRLEEGHPNTVKPGKRPMHTLNCFIVLKNGKPVIISGSPGADFQTQGNLQIITSILDHGLTPQEAVDAPRWHSIPGSHPLDTENPPEVQLEPRMSETVSDALIAKKHKITWGQEGISHGIFQVISVNQETGVLAGASDPRGDGYAAGF